MIDEASIGNIKLVETIYKFMKCTEVYLEDLYEEEHPLQVYYSVWLQLQKLIGVIKQILDDTYGPMVMNSKQSDRFM